MAGDLFANLKPRPVEDIVIDGRIYHIPPLAARPWLDILLTEGATLWDIVPGLLAEEHAADEVTAALIHDRITGEEYIDLVEDILEAAAARPLWVTQRLLDCARNPQVGDTIRGQLVLHRVDADNLSLSAWLDALYALLTAGVTVERRQQFDIKLNQLPPNKRHRIDRKQQAANFEALMGT